MVSPVRLSLKRLTARLSRACLLIFLVLAWLAPASMAADGEITRTVVVFSYGIDWLEQTVDVSDLEGEQPWTFSVLAKQTANGPDRIGLEIEPFDQEGASLGLSSLPLSPVQSEWAPVSLSGTADWGSWASLRLRIYGKDAEFWGGNYGPQVDYATLEIGGADETARIANASFDLAEGYAPSGWTSSRAWDSCQGLYTATLCLGQITETTTTTTTTTTSSSTSSTTTEPSSTTSSSSEAPTTSPEAPSSSEEPSTTSETPTTSESPTTTVEASIPAPDPATTISSTWPPTTESTSPTTTPTTVAPIPPVPVTASPTTISPSSTGTSPTTSTPSTTSQPQDSEPPPPDSSPEPTPETSVARTEPSTATSPPTSEEAVVAPEPTSSLVAEPEPPSSPSPTTSLSTTTTSEPPTTVAEISAPGNWASEGEKRQFEEAVNVFDGGFDSYVPAGSNVTVAQRRTIVAVTTVVSTLTPVGTARRRGGK